jgi:hypothetical protein
MTVEPLESRISPATLVNPGTVTFTDFDGDTVVVKTSRGTFDLATDFVFQDMGGGHEQLSLLNLSSEFAGAQVKVAVTKRGAEGDGLVNVGYINASTIDLASISVQGDLGRIDAGDATASTPALGILKVRSLGLYGTATQSAGGSLSSTINGNLGKLVVTTDIQGASLNVVGRLGSVAIGGSLVGGEDTGTVGGNISATDIGPVKIGRDIIGGEGSGNGSISSDGMIASVSVGGSLFGGAGALSGLIRSGGVMGPVKIAHDVIGGTGLSAGSISSESRISSLNIGGSVIGGIGGNSAGITSNGEIGSIRIGGNVLGTGAFSARISAGGAIASVKIVGSLIGQDRESGRIATDGDLGSVFIGKNVKGGPGDESGKIDASGRIARVTIGGSLLGGDGDYNTGAGIHIGQIFSGKSMGVVRIGGNLQGATGVTSGSIVSDGGIAGVSVGGSVIGGENIRTGSVVARGSDLGLVRIGHDVRGGSGVVSGGLSGQTCAGVIIGGSLIGGSGNNAGTIGANSGIAFVRIGHDVAGGSGVATAEIVNAHNLLIGGSLIGGSGTASGFVSNNGVTLHSVRIAHDLIGGSIAGTTGRLTSSGYIQSGKIGRIFIGGSIIAGIDDSTAGDLQLNASIRAEESIGSLTVKGSLIGNLGSNGDARVIISARGTNNPDATTDIAIGKVTIGGRAEFSQILAGYDTDLNPENADAQIGAVTVGGDWIASNIVAGAMNLGVNDAPGGSGVEADNVNFGDAHDSKIVEAGESTSILSRIGRIQVAGQIFGTPEDVGSNDRFGFVAEEIGALKIGLRTFGLNDGGGNNGIPLGLETTEVFSDTTLHEIGAAIGSTAALVSPAKLINASTVVYTDSDGDRVTVKLSQPLLTEANVNDVFRFDNGMVGGTDLSGQQLQFIDLGVLATNGLGVDVTVKRGGGDGLAQIGTIRSEDFDIGSVRVAGDLGGIRGGDDDLGTVGLASLKVRTYGRYGLDTQPEAGGGFIPQLGGEINGGIGSLTVQRDLVGPGVDISGSIGRVTIGGSLIGNNGRGVISTTGPIGDVKIGQDLVGGRGGISGSISSSGVIGSVSIGGSLIGGAGASSGFILPGGEIGQIKIAHNMIGGTGGNSGVIIPDLAPSIRIGGSLIGGVGALSGRLGADGAIGPVFIAHNLIGGASNESGLIDGLSLSSITIGGSLVGGDGRASGTLHSSLDIGPLKIAHDAHGGRGNESGKISSGGNLTSLAIGGSLIGDQGRYDTTTQLGQVFVEGDLGLVTIGKDIIGGAGVRAAELRADGTLARIIVRGSLVGGSNLNCGHIVGQAMGFASIGGDIIGGVGSSSGEVFSNSNLDRVILGGSLIGGVSDSGRIAATDDVGSVKVGGDVKGGSGADSGQIVLDQGVLASAVINGSVVGGTNYNAGGVFAERGIGSVRVGHHLIGGSIAGTDSGVDGIGFILTSGGIDSVTIGGSVIAGIDNSTMGELSNCGTIRANNDIDTITIKGSLIGNATTNGISLAIISARGQALSPSDGTPDRAIQTLTIGGRVDHAQILGGYDRDLSALNGNAVIGDVIVGGNWIASDLVAGALVDADPNTAPNFFGDADDQPFLTGGGARIESITIKGLVIGTAGSNDHYGFVAPGILSFKSLGFTATLTSEMSPDVIEMSLPTGDVTIREV